MLAASTARAMQRWEVPATVWTRRVAPYALVSAPRADAGDRWQRIRSARCACKAADTAGSATCSHHNHDTFTQPSTCARDGCERRCECIGHGGRAALHRHRIHFFRRLLMCSQPWIARKLESQPEPRTVRCAAVMTGTFVSCRVVGAIQCDTMRISTNL